MRTELNLRALCLWPTMVLALMAGLSVAARPLQAGEAGKVIWVDLLTEDASTAIDFYEALFGWQIDLHREGIFVVRNGSTPIAAISEIEDRHKKGEEAIWLPGIMVDDLAGAVAKAKELGATIHRDVSRAEGFASFAVFEDPQGAPVMLLAPERPFDEAPPIGSWIWTELWTHDTAAAADFYGQVVGYERVDTDRGGQPYALLQTGDEPRAGLVAIEDRQVEPIWAPYLGVADVAATAAKAEGLGGRVLLAPDAEIGEGRVALLADPTGGAFFIYQIEGETP